jgi:hypothetical protein
MPFDWTAEKERLMLLMAIQEANVKPTKQLWSTVAAKLGGGLSPSAVRYDPVNEIRCNQVPPAQTHHQPLLTSCVAFHLLRLSSIPRNSSLT